MTNSMYLKTIKIRNFRSCYETDVELQPDLTLIVGENNAGKSNVVDALRLATMPAGGRRDRYFESNDHAVGREDVEITISTEFNSLTEIQEAQYITALNLDSKVVRYQTRFKVDQSKPQRSKPTYHAGKAAAADVEPEKREQIRHVYLAPLRDAQRELSSADGNRLARIIETLFNEDERDRFVAAANKKLSELDSDPVLTGSAKNIQAHLSGLTDPVRKQQIGINFTDQRLNRLVRGLRIKMAEQDIDLANLAESGLGYANLLYIATVILELSKADDAELTLFLVEEPEAHLHPQLQIALLEYLREVAAESGRDDTQGPAGRIQVIATTHSPNLASGVSVDNVVVLRTTDIAVKVKEPVEVEDGEIELRERVVNRQRTVTIPIAELNLDPKQSRKISQYLDVTKCALLFARTVVLVEGIAEAVVMPALARHCVLHGDGESQRKNRRRFQATSIISVEGVDFEPYIRLLLCEVGGHSVIDRLIIVTDGDPALPDAEEESPDGDESEDDDLREDDSPAELLVGRKSRLEALANRLGVGAKLEVFASEYTFEADLLSKSVNLPVLRECYLNQRTRSAKKWKEIAESESPAEEFYRRLRKNSKYIGKGEFAHDVALAIEKKRTFECPDYLRKAIQAAVRDEVRGGTN